jgi:hypothetical protein
MRSLRYAKMVTSEQLLLPIARFGQFPAGRLALHAVGTNIAPALRCQHAPVTRDEQAMLLAIEQSVIAARDARITD